MKQYKLLLLSIFLLFSCNDSGVVENQIDNIFKEFQSGLTPGVSVAVVKKGMIIYQKGIGYADLENKIEITPKTNFRLASITKQFTSMSVLILENEGKISLEDRLPKYFPELKHYAEDIRIKNVLQHTSGLLDYEHFVTDTNSVQLKDKDVLNILTDQDSIYFKPGTKHKYSNSGYAILALLVERVSGKSFAKFLDERIFKPLKMNNTVAYENGISTISNHAFGYTKTDTGFVFTDQSLTSAVLGDGGIYSSTIDLLKWDNEINSPTLLSKEKFDKIFEKGKTLDGESFDYGFGWRLDPYNNHFRPYHTGSTKGFSNIYMKIPDLDLTIILLMNVNEYNAKQYAERVADLFL